MQTFHKNVKSTYKYFYIYITLHVLSNNKVYEEYFLFSLVNKTALTTLGLCWLIFTAIQCCYLTRESRVLLGTLTNLHTQGWVICATISWLGTVHRQRPQPTIQRNLNHWVHGVNHYDFSIFLILHLQCHENMYWYVQLELYHV